MSIDHEGDVNRCIMMELEEMATVESVNCKGAGNQFACYYWNFMMIEAGERCDQIPRGSSSQ